MRDLGFTHIELLPITEHPFDASWGYQTTGYYAVTSRQARPTIPLFRRLCHATAGCCSTGAGALPLDPHGLAFDGTALYERGPAWAASGLGALIFNYRRNEVRGFPLANAVHSEGFHIDGCAWTRSRP